MKKSAIILYGPPGSGKGTQANLLAGKLNLIHFDSGKFLEAVVHDPLRQKEKFIQKERELFDTGKLLTPSFVFKEAARAVTKIAKGGLGVVFSGAPRTVYEAKGLMPILERLYGKKNIFVFEFKLPPNHSVKRNSTRMICRSCGYMLLNAYYPKVRAKHCPVCGGNFYKRTLDNPKVIKVRLKEYKERTMPAFTLLRKMGYKIHAIDAKMAPYKVLHKVVSNIFLSEKKKGFIAPDSINFYQFLF
ncbi:MAG: nucleoside monophosphate kinase [Patescibacteria group bacterium]|nr:nucleoside monophosphate kinase [Patescibacteria group bacterium]MDE2015575.1 nucleoside monophosphate kinase [Patescibacteria group bacterium]MDE2227229.1 nucleoside monophosphate kinase [Patescibacteria group bacterium]